MISEEMLSLLVCPKCKGPVVLWIWPDQQTNNERECLDCQKCRLRYPINGKVPLLLVNEAKSY